MKSPEAYIEFYKGDFEYSAQVSAEAVSVRVFCIDWQRLFSWKVAGLETSNGSSGQQAPAFTAYVPIEGIGTVTTVIPVMGEQLRGKVNSYALFNLMAENPGYDIVIYPQYETKTFIVPLLYSKRTSRVTARLARINP